MFNSEPYFIIILLMYVTSERLCTGRICREGALRGLMSAAMPFLLLGSGALRSLVGVVLGGVVPPLLPAAPMAGYHGTRVTVAPSYIGGEGGTQRHLLAGNINSRARSSVPTCPCNTGYYT